MRRVDRKTSVVARCALTGLALASLVLAASASSSCSGRVGGHAGGVGASVVIRGSDTMLDLVHRWAEHFMDESPGVAVEVSGGGTGTGIAALVNGTVDIACASRPLTSSERAAIRAHRGAEVRETHVALDAVALYVHATNPVRSLTVEQLSGVYRGQLTNWAEIGGVDLPIVLYGRENSSGTYAFFKEVVLGQLDFAAETQSLSGTAAVIQAVSYDPKGIGYGGIGNAHGVARVSLARHAGDAPVAPGLGEARSGRYPLTRHLSLITTTSAAPSARRFVDWARSLDGQRIVESAGFYPLEPSLAEARIR